MQDYFGEGDFKNQGVPVCMCAHRILMMSLNKIAKITRVIKMITN